MRGEILRIEDVVKQFDVGGERVPAVDGVSLAIAAGEMVALYGPSGSGKSTLIDLIAGFQTPDAGTIVVDGRDVRFFSEREHADYLRLIVGIIGQEDELWPSASAPENACLKLLRDHPKQAQEMVEPLLEELGLGERMNQPTSKLSRGERQRVMIAQALSTDPRLVLADEPTGSLDTRRSRDVLGQIRDLCASRGTAVLLVTHDPQAVAFADRVYELRDGQLHDYQPARQVLPWRHRRHSAAEAMSSLPPAKRGRRDGSSLVWLLRQTIPLGEILFIFGVRLKERAILGQQALAVIGISVGVALLFASQVASQSLDGSVRQLTHQLVGGAQYQLDARGPDGFAEGIAREAAALPGVSAALPLLEQQAIVIGPRGRESVDLVGADPRFAHLGGPLLRKFTARQLEHQRVVALPEPVAQSIGAGALEVLELQIGTSTVEVLLGATLSRADVGGLADSEIALAPLSYAQVLAGMRHRLSRVFIKVEPGRQREAAAGLRRLAEAHDLNAVPADFDARLFSVAAAPAQQGETLFSVISAIVGFLFAFNAMLLTVPDRRRLIETMRRRGFTRLTIVQALTFDALVIGALATALGLGLGELLSTALFHAEPDYLAFAFPVGGPRVVSFSTIALSVAAGFLATLVGVLAPVRHLLALPLRSRVEVERQPRGWTALRLGTGVLGLLVTTLIVLLRPQSAVVGVITLVIAGLALLPFLFRGIVLGFARAQRPFASAATRLAVGELKDTMTSVRSLAVASTGALAVFGTVAVAGAQDNLQSGLNSASHEWNRAADIWVYPSGDDNSLATTPFAASLASRIEHVEDVRSVTIYRGSFLNVGERRVWVIAPPRQSAEPMPAGQLTDGDADQVNRRLRGHGWAVLSEAVARELHLHVGQSFTLPSPQPTSFRVAGLSTNGGWPPGAIVINADDYARAWGSNAASALNVHVAPGRAASEARLQIIRALGPDSGLAVQTAGEREAQWARLSGQGFARLTQIKTIVLIAAILAMAFVMTSLIWQRRERIGLLKRAGYRKGLLWRSLLFESAVLLGSGCLIGAVIGLYGQLVISHALTTVTGFPITIGVGVLIAIFSFLVVSATALAIVAIPGYLATRVRATMVEPA